MRWLKRIVYHWVNEMQRECVATYPSYHGGPDPSLTALTNDMSRAFAVYPLRNGFLLRVDQVPTAQIGQPHGPQRQYSVHVEYVADTDELLRRMIALNATKTLGV